jgi:hypothetical protein
MGLGVFTAAPEVAWERAASTGLFNFDSGYRLVGRFSGRYTGGAAAFLALSLLDSLFGFPRISLIVYLIPSCALLDGKKAMPKGII